ncbi:MAG: threonylcarbamoyl-AMP synthase [Clostridia bacterium]|nr:threonylcarbamoyl-AMP synthase [Clostridia bacterium]
MNTRIFKISPTTPKEKDITDAADILKSGGLVAFPTETVYGLGGDATDPDAAKKIYSAKGRPSDNPLIIHIATPEDAERYAYTTEIYYKLAKAFMPGPLTVILKKRNTVPETVTGGLDTVAVRCPAHPIAHELIARAGVAIAAPSANLSGSPSPTCGEHVISDMNGRIDAIIDGGECDIGLESTIVKPDGNSLILLRPGAITADALSCVCEKVVISEAVTEALKENERPLSPGMKYKHYAPSVPLTLLDGEDAKVLEFLKNSQKTEKCAILCYAEELSALLPERLIDIGKKDDLNTQASRLFAALRNTEALECDIIYAHLPKTQGIGLALYNRLIRAAAHTVKHIN